MIILLSPAKSLDYDTPASTAKHTLPQFLDESAALIDVLRPYTPAQIASLMDLSDPLATLNVARYAAWSPHFSASNSKQAILAFNGDVYEGLDAASLSEQELLLLLRLAWLALAVVLAGEERRTQREGPAGERRASRQGHCSVRA